MSGAVEAYTQPDAVDDVAIAQTLFLMGAEMIRRMSYRRGSLAQRSVVRPDNIRGRLFAVLVHFAFCLSALKQRRKSPISPVFYGAIACGMLRDLTSSFAAHLLQRSAAPRSELPQHCIELGPVWAMLLAKEGS